MGSRNCTDGFPIVKHAVKVIICKIAIISEENTLLMMILYPLIKKKKKIQSEGEGFQSQMLELSFLTITQCCN